MVISRKIQQIQRVVISGLLSLIGRPKIVAVEYSVIPVIVDSKSLLNTVFIQLHGIKIPGFSCLLPEISQCKETVGFNTVHHTPVFGIVCSPNKAVFLVDNAHNPVRASFDIVSPSVRNSFPALLHESAYHIGVLSTDTGGHHVVYISCFLIVVSHTVRNIIVNIPASWHCAGSALF